MSNSEWEKLIVTLVNEKLLRSPRVIEAMRSVPRDKFLPENMRTYTAVDTPLPIGYGQTISAPHVTSSLTGSGETWFQ